MTAAVAVSLSRFEEARQILLTRARFGDRESIAARDLLAHVEECVDAIGKCPHKDFEDAVTCTDCRGRGRRDCHECGHEGTCVFCDGAGEIAVPCSCIRRFDEDVFGEASCVAVAGRFGPAPWRAA
jgi:DnaJ-class molecular chaperone